MLAAAQVSDRSLRQSESAIGAVTFDDVAREQERKGFVVKFLPSLESIYRSESEKDQYKAVFFNWVVGVFLYTSFILSDYIVAGVNLPLYVGMRFGFVLPVSIVALWLIAKPRKFYQLHICIIPLAMSIGLSAALILGRGDYRASYLFGDILLMMCGCMLSRPRFPYALSTVFLQWICYHVALLSTDIESVANQTVSSLFCTSGAVVALLVCYAMEQMNRNSFLLSLRVRLLNRTLGERAVTDPLTGLGNRHLFEEITASFWATSQVEPQLASVVLIDVDLFKSFNDNYGHSAGDLCLSTLARRIRGQLRKQGDVAIRFGGEEMLMFLPCTDFTDARLLAEQIRLAIIDAAVPHPIIGADNVVTASLGVATARTDLCSCADLVVQADLALYAAKHHGRNRIWPPMKHLIHCGAAPTRPGRRRTRCGSRAEGAVVKRTESGA